MINILEWLPCPHCKARPFRYDADTVKFEHSAYCPDFVCDTYPATNDAMCEFNRYAIDTPLRSHTESLLKEFAASVIEAYRDPMLDDGALAASIDALVASMADSSLVAREETDLAVLPLYESAKPGSISVFECVRCGWQGHMTLGGMLCCPSCGRTLRHGLTIFTRAELKQFDETKRKREEGASRTESTTQNGKNLETT